MTDRKTLEKTLRGIESQIRFARWITPLAAVTALVLANCGGASSGWQALSFFVASVLAQCYAYVSAVGFGYSVAHREVAENNLRASDENVAR